MNTGILSVRYAKALLEYSRETGHADRVYHQVNNLLKHPEITPDRLEPELERFVALLIRNHRMEGLRFILRTYLRMYYDSKGIKAVHLTTAVPSQDLEKQLVRLLERKFGCKVLLESVVDPSLIGGFVIRVDDYMLDASVRGRVESIRRQFIIQNNRIV